ncbi:MAG: flagellar assembly protein FliH [Hyphomicrobiales bacterium]|uniref:FliH/SctL family protein n=1 Tax=Rhabdaerophilum calidifontis TaxID=2604328 RepID=UPI00123A05F7|nr:FliH/SctL family protein [Rhabdaerophilum calidifontis]MCA1952877.1 flagellar assembly protein FliH [Hyphomicrobiales bacterium]MCA1999119.1 flagellar assembly protein FliH [Hyphomicrobiales bacterium]
MADAHSTFTFNRDFTRAGRGTPFVPPGARVPVPYAEHIRLLEEAKAAAMAAGIAEGRRLQTDHEAMRLATCLDQILAQLQVATIEMRRLEEEARREAVEFGMIFARKLAGRMIENQPLGPIEATARAIFNDIRGTPHLALRVAPDLVDSCKSRIGALLAENGLETRLFVFPDPEIAAGDCRIEWADGGIVRDRAKLEALLERAMALLFPAPDNTILDG